MRCRPNADPSPAAAPPKGRAVATNAATVAALIALGAAAFGIARAPEAPSQYIVIAQNDLGMHCMQRDYSNFMILPPFNTVRAWVIKRGNNPDLLSPESGLDVSFLVPSNTRSADKTNWWRYAPQLLGLSFPPDVGLTGNSLSGMMAHAPGYWEITGVPLTPLDDAGRDNPYPLAEVTFIKEGTPLATTQTVVPVSWELSCNLCHGDPSPGLDADLDVLRDHDRLHGTSLELSRPVNCSSCHADPALGAPGVPGISMLSHAIHGAHADRVGSLPVTLETECYACHPGRRAQCQRDVHFGLGSTCNSCHGDMADVGAPARMPWIDEPRCADCHSRAGFEFEQPGKLYRESVGHAGVACVVCHGAPHAITPTVTEVDNLQAIRLQGHAGVIAECATCHTAQPDEPFFHRVED